MKNKFIAFVGQVCPTDLPNCHSELVSESQKHKMLKQVQHDRKRGFTLAEVLITLTIIGVIAALTIPNLMQKWSDHADVVKVKEAYSILSNAIKLAIRENGEINEWNWPQKAKGYPKENGQYCNSIITQYLKVSKDCSNTQKDLCAIYSTINLQGQAKSAGYTSFNYYYSSFILQNGMNITSNMYWIEPTSIYTNISFMVDINGRKKPNRIGYDIFYFNFKSNGTLYDKYNSLHCNAQKNYDIADSNNGMSCANWIIKHGNMDYKYRDVSAEW